MAILGSARAFYDAAKNELTSIRSAAENWIKGVGALLGLFSVAGLVFAKDSVATLSRGYQQAFATAAAIALIAAATGTYLAYRAAFGWPRNSKVDNDKKLREFFAQQQTRARRSATALHFSVATTLLSLVALGAALAFLWFGTPAAPPSPLVKVTSNDGRSPCGALLEKGAGDAVRVRTAQGEVVSVQPVAISAITTVKKCG